MARIVMNPVNLHQTRLQGAANPADHPDPIRRSSFQRYGRRVLVAARGGGDGGVEGANFPQRAPVLRLQTLQRAVGGKA